MDKLDEIIINNINKYLLREHASNRLYHYINGSNLVLLLKKNKMMTSSPETYYKNGVINYIDGEKQRYISFTRNRNAKEGYPVLKYSSYGDGDEHFICRIELDGDYLNTHNIKRYDKRLKSGQKRIDYKIKPMDWCYWDYAEGGNKFAMADNCGVFASNGKEWQMQSDSKDYYYPIDDYAYDTYNHPMSQAEDRLTTTEKYIPNANNFIQKIDIFVSQYVDYKDYRVLYSISNYAEKLGISVNFYDNFNEFNQQHENKSFGIEGVAMMIWN